MSNRQGNCHHSAKSSLPPHWPAFDSTVRGQRCRLTKQPLLAISLPRTSRTPPERAAERETGGQSPYRAAVASSMTAGAETWLRIVVAIGTLGEAPTDAWH